jgi:hypothetical protein
MMASARDSGSARELMHVQECGRITASELVRLSHLMTRPDGDRGVSLLRMRGAD